MVWIKPDRVVRALHNLGEWRKTVQDQGARHLLPLLALLEKGAGNKTPIQFDETPHEFDFWNRYFRLDAADSEKPYFNPITSRLAEKGYPHSNAATIRKNTFANKWRAAVRTETATGDQWQLADDYATRVRDKVLTKAGKVTRVPLIDLAVVLFRDEELPEALGSALELGQRFRARFPQSDEDYQQIFELRDEEADRLFVNQDAKPSYSDAIRSALIADVSQVSESPPISNPATISDPDDSTLSEVQELLRIGTSGIILRGPPGTGKTHYAHRIAKSLVKDAKADVFRVQFHPSYGYEDFVEGYRPDDAKTSGFDIFPKIFVEACDRARAQPQNYVVLIVDEINRGDPARVFGELLTYLERGYRSVEFKLPFSGKAMSIPPNLLMIGTMNPYDRSVSHIDAAFVRRFDHIDIAPSREVAEDLLEEGGGFTATQIELIGTWFEAAQKMVPVGLGHSFFKGVNNLDTLKTIWRYRIRPTAESLMELDDAVREGFAKSFSALIARLEGVVGET